MKRIMSLAAVGVTIGVASVVSLSAMQKMTLIHPGGGGSPHVLTEWQIEGAKISIEYGRPYLKGRTVGEDIVPYGEVWRVGADEATTLKSDKDLVFGKLTVPAGEHTLWILPTAKDKWQLIVSKDTGIFGTDYNPENDLGRADMTAEDVRPRVEQHTISIFEAEAGGGILVVEFGAARAYIPFKVKK